MGLRPEKYLWLMLLQPLTSLTAAPPGDENWEVPRACPTLTRGEVRAMAVFRGQVYVNGAFLSAGGLPVTNLACWTGEWKPIFPRLAYSTTTFATGNSYLFINAPDGADSYLSTLYAWDGTNLISLNVTNEVGRIWAFGDDLYVAGYFTNIAGIAARGIAHWNGTNWSALGTG